MQQGPTSPTTPQNSIATKPVQHSAAFWTAVSAGISLFVSMIPDITHLINSHAHMLPHAWQPFFVKLAIALGVFSDLYNRWDTKRAANEGPGETPPQ